MTICAGCKIQIPENQDHDLCDACSDMLMSAAISFVVGRDMEVCIICDELRHLDNLVVSEGGLVCREGCYHSKQFKGEPNGKAKTRNQYATS